MALLSAIRRSSGRAARLALLSALAFVGACSLALDTESLQEGSGGSAGASNCPQVPDKCANCIGQSCCGQYVLCAHTPKCQQSFTTLEQCMQTGTAPAACLLDFSNNGGPAAAALSTCAASNCGAPCSG